MACKKLFVKTSKIQGTGLYAGESIKAGDVVMLWMSEATIITEAEYNQRQEADDKLIKTTGVRYIGSYFLHTDEKPRYENYINHSFTPNILYHCGICFALKDIECGEELTVNYSYLLSESDSMGFVDERTGLKVSGLPYELGLMDTCKQLLQLIKNKERSSSHETNLLNSLHI